jgi:hypothetical protein
MDDWLIVFLAAVAVIEAIVINLGAIYLCLLVPGA